MAFDFGAIFIYSGKNAGEFAAGRSIPPFSHCGPGQEVWSRKPAEWCLW